MKIKLFLMCFLTLLFFSELSFGEIYRYQDKYGRWQYTDKEPPDQVKSEIVKIKGSDEVESSDEPAGENLTEFFTKKINPSTEIEKASLAVVKIESPYGAGAGFFITESGYLITNKQVVRPSSSVQIEDQLKQAEANVKKSKVDFEARGRELEQYKKLVDDDQQRIQVAPADKKAAMEKEYYAHNIRYNDLINEVPQARQRIAMAEQELAARTSSMSAAAVTSVFKIVFKEGTVKKAKLIMLSEDKNLALLKMTENSATPFLKPGQREKISQGSEVFAIGSPGAVDFVTRELVVRQEPDRIVTDIATSPVNSGGPLVTPQGEVIGINTSVYHANDAPGSGVSGFAIPIEQARKEFSAYW